MRRKDDVAMPPTPSFPAPLIIGAQPKLTSAPRGLPDAASAMPDTVLDATDVPGWRSEAPPSEAMSTGTWG